MAEKRLPHNPAIVPQLRSWTCGPASAENVLYARGINKAELSLRDEIEALEGNVGWDDEDGTDNITQVATVLNRYVGGGYVVRTIGGPSRTETELLWTDVVNSVDAGYGVVGNINVPQSNFPRATRGSQSPRYNGSFIWHYLSIMGYADDGPGGRHVWVVDSGFSPNLYWASLEQMASMIAGKGYTAKPVGAPQPEFLNNLPQHKQDVVWSGFAQLEGPSR